MKKEDFRRSADEHRRCLQGLDALAQKPFLTADEKLEEVRLKKLKLRLREQMECMEASLSAEPSEKDEKCAIIEEQITRYAYGEPIAPKEERTLKAHLRQCPSCEQFVSFVRKSRAVAEADSAPEIGRTGCPSTEELRKLVNGTLNQLSKPRADEIRQHILNCRWCRAEYLLMSNLANEEIPDHLFDPGHQESTANPDVNQHAEEARKSLKAELLRLTQQLSQCSQRLDALQPKPPLSEDEKLEAVRLKKLKHRLEDQMEMIERQFRTSKDKIH